ncbi:MAG: hypothetical protein JNK69_08255 [Saprospiraceae bacterium]|nr:hypothetical protein [Candidatus Vicinibacter proximus]MBL7823385.1 hypothetical protein [Saprospiraceae bacterium]MCC6842416.1 hypothetical protein [Saprospiraceae bacterium]HRG32272.1 hypothetical protein [Saprospiraceae bacterium]
MKTYLILAFALISFAVRSQDTEIDQKETGLPGDHFSLQGALDLFKKSSSPEEFEKLLNTESNQVNNLDLNGDGEIDYIRVVDQTEDDVHALILQAVVNDKESQDIAVIEIEKDGSESAVLQIIGDDEIFGESFMVEPYEEEASGGKGGPDAALSVNYVVVNVWGWPCIRFMYAPVYRPWVSPWRWATYPGWWRPWRPLGWAVWRPHVRVYRPGYRVVTTHRVVRAHRVYSPVRVHSVTVRTKNSGNVKHYRTTKKTTVIGTGPGGNKVKASRTKTTTVHQGPKGNKVKTTHTKTKVSRKR